MDCYYNQYHRENTISWIFHQVNSRDGVDFFMLFTLRESRRASDPVLSRARGKRRQLHPRRLGSEALRLLQRWGLIRLFSLIFLLFTLSGCGFFLKAPDVTSKTSLKKLSVSQYPVFTDDHAYKNLGPSIEQSLVYLRKIPADLSLIHISEPTRR